MTGSCPVCVRQVGENMVMTDSISDMIVRIKAATLRKKDVVDMPGSKVKKAIAHLLKEEGFIVNYEELTKGKKKFLRLRLKYARNEYGRVVGSAIKEMKRISKPGCRVYKPVSEIHRQDVGFAILIVSTSKGLRTDGQARKEKLGGEILIRVA